MEEQININNVVIPDTEAAHSQSLLGDGTSLTREGIEKVINKDKIKTTQLKEVTGVNSPAYIIDLRRVKAVVGSVISTIGMLTSKEQLEKAETKVHIYLVTSTGMKHMGEADGDTMYRLLVPFIQSCFGNSANVGYTVDGKKVIKVNKTSITDIKLNL